jgi:Dihydrodipicolinate synthetase family
LIYSVPVFTNYDMPEELIRELAGHPNIVGIKESGGDMEKIRRMVEATRHINRTAMVTETFAAVTPRMLKGAGPAPSVNTNELIPVGMLTGAATGHAGAGAPTATAYRRDSLRPQNPPERSWVSDSCRGGAETSSIA